MGSLSYLRLTVALGLVLALGAVGCASSRTNRLGVSGSVNSSTVSKRPVISTAELSAIGQSSPTSTPVSISATGDLPQSAPWFKYQSSQSSQVPMYFDFSQDYRSVTVPAPGSSSSLEVIKADGTHTTLLQSNTPQSSSWTFLDSPDQRWAVSAVPPGSSSVQLYSLASPTALPRTINLASEPGALAASLIGFTSDDRLIINSVNSSASLRSMASVYTIDLSGGNRRPFQTADPNCCGTLDIGPTLPIGLTDAVSGVPEAGVSALISTQYETDNHYETTTDLFSADQALIHRFADTEPLSFSPDGRYLVLQHTPSTLTPKLEVCDLSDLQCQPLPSDVGSHWLPNNDLIVVGPGYQVPEQWWNPRTGQLETPPAAFGKITDIAYILPTSLLKLIASVEG